MKTRRKPLGTLNAIGGRIAEIRISKRIKQKDFIARLQAKDMDINPSSYSKLEGQTRKISDLEIIVIAKMLGVAVQDLFRE
ncbi:MAG: helix-turn-helix domain-containing protein [Defluviitaleaceae bacterium]|nr:helix-turn-helix domain-containing protein [Defluviitaleaceae bacterium]